MCGKATDMETITFARIVYYLKFPRERVMPHNAWLPEF